MILVFDMILVCAVLFAAFSYGGVFFLFFSFAASVCDIFLVVSLLFADVIFVVDFYLFLVVSLLLAYAIFVVVFFFFFKECYASEKKIRD
jgi:hypothetical protein